MIFRKAPAVKCGINDMMNCLLVFYLYNIKNDKVENIHEKFSKPTTRRRHNILLKIRNDHPNIEEKS